MALSPGDEHWIRRLTFWLMLPVTGVQGLRLRNRALRLAPPKGQACGEFGSGETLHILALGDSIIAGVGANSQEKTLPIQFAKALSARLHSRTTWNVKGRNGANLDDLLASARAIEAGTEADIFLLSIGVNDVTGLTSTRRWRNGLTQLFDQLRNRWPRCLVVFCGLPPMEQFPLPPQPLRFSLGLRARTLDRIAASLLSERQNMLHIATVIKPEHHEFCADGFHPSERGYEIWAGELVEEVVSELPDPQQGFTSKANPEA